MERRFGGEASRDSNSDFSVDVVSGSLNKFVRMKT